MSRIGSIDSFNGDKMVMLGLLALFAQEHRVDLHGGRTICTVYTNEISVINGWIQLTEEYMLANELVFVDIDIKYTPLLQKR